MRRLSLLAVLASCWTGSAGDPAPLAPAAPEPKPPGRAQIRIKLERTACFGECPTYTVELLPDGRVHWHGENHVAAQGTRARKVSPRALAALERELEQARFFERDESGRFPMKPECTTDGTTTTCSLASRIVVCSDTPHAIITVTRLGERHVVDYDHCSDDQELERLAERIDEIAGTREWVGR